MAIDESYYEDLQNHPVVSQIAAAAKHIYSSSITGLNDTSSEYVVQTIKHFFDTIIIVQYAITNTLED
jgi:Coatomer gamma subunit appendage platform subdomain